MTTKTTFNWMLIMAICSSLSCCGFFPERTTTEHLKKMDAHVLENLFYLGSSRGRHYFRNDAYGCHSFWWIPSSELSIAKQRPLKRSWKGVPADIADKRFKITITASNLKEPRTIHMTKP